MNKKQDKEKEEFYRSGYHQAVNECLRLVEAAVEQHASPAQVLEVLTSWEFQLARWRGYIDEADLHASPPRPSTPHLRLVQKESEDQP